MGLRRIVSQVLTCLTCTFFQALAARGVPGLDATACTIPKSWGDPDAAVVGNKTGSILVRPHSRTDGRIRGHFQVFSHE
jgi:hypothetical protein